MSCLRDLECCEKLFFKVSENIEFMRLLLIYEDAMLMLVNDFGTEILSKLFANLLRIIINQVFVIKKGFFESWFDTNTNLIDSIKNIISD